MTYADIGAAAVKYMAEKMAMPDTSTDQEQNWILGHMVTFSNQVANAARTDAEEGLSRLLAIADAYNGWANGSVGSTRGMEKALRAIGEALRKPF